MGSVFWWRSNIFIYFVFIMVCFLSKQSSSHLQNNRKSIRAVPEESDLMLICKSLTLRLPCTQTHIHTRIEAALVIDNNTELSVMMCVVSSGLRSKEQRLHVPNEAFIPQCRVFELIPDLRGQSIRFSSI